MDYVHLIMLILTSWLAQRYGEVVLHMREYEQVSIITDKLSQLLDSYLYILLPDASLNHQRNLSTLPGFIIPFR